MPRDCSRQDDEGNLLRLEEQDRTRWNQAMIAADVSPSRIAAGAEISEYHLQAGSRRVTPRRSTMNRLIGPRFFRSTIDDRVRRFACGGAQSRGAVANVHGPEAGLQTVRAIPEREKLDAYYLFYAVMGELE